MNHIWFTSEFPFSSLCYICYIRYKWFTYGLLMNFIQFTYERWILLFLHMLHVIYIQFTYENWAPHILKKIRNHFRVLILNCWLQVWTGLAGQGRSKQPWKMRDASNAATNWEATGTNPLNRQPRNYWTLGLVVYRVCLKHNVVSASNGHS